MNPELQPSNPSLVDPVVPTPQVPQAIQQPPVQSSIIQKPYKKAWAVTILVILIAVAVPAILFAITALQDNAWAKQNSAKYNSLVSNLETASNEASSAARSDNLNALAAACQDFQNGAKKLKALPNFPESSAQAKLNNAIQILTKGAAECVLDITQNKVSYLITASDELNSGMNALTNATSSIKAATK
jgi:hypothetical protein